MVSLIPETALQVEGLQDLSLDVLIARGIENTRLCLAFMNNPSREYQRAVTELVLSASQSRAPKAQEAYVAYLRTVQQKLLAERESLRSHEGADEVKVARMRELDSAVRILQAFFIGMGMASPDTRVLAVR